MSRYKEVRVGQLWADNDWRSKGRLVRVVKVEGRYAWVQTIATPRGAVVRQKVTRILLRRFKPTSTGYRFLSGGPA